MILFVHFCSTWTISFCFFTLTLHFNIDFPPKEAWKLDAFVSKRKESENIRLSVFTQLFSKMVSVATLKITLPERARKRGHLSTSSLPLHSLFRLIQENDCNIFANMQKTDFREFRNLIIDMVLHTDMSQHFSQLKAMKSVIQQNSGEAR